MIIFIDARDNVNPYARHSTDPAGSPQLHFSQSSQPPHHGTSKQSCWHESKLAWRARTVLGDVRDGKRGLFSFLQVHSSPDEENACKTKWLGKIIVTAALETQSAWKGKMRLDGMLHGRKRMSEEEEQGRGRGGHLAGDPLDTACAFWWCGRSTAARTWVRCPSLGCPTWERWESAKGGEEHWRSYGGLDPRSTGWGSGPHRPWPHGGRFAGHSKATRHRAPRQGSHTVFPGMRTETWIFFLVGQRLATLCSKWMYTVSVTSGHFHVTETIKHPVVKSIAAVPLSCQTRDMMRKSVHV